jgi:hypothetical protein
MEVDEQGYRAARKFEICHYRSGVNAFDSFDGFQFDDHRVVYEQIETVAAVHLDAPVNKRHRLLSLDGEPALHEVPHEASLVTGFQQPRTQLTMNLDSCTNDGSGYVVNVHSEYSECSVVIIPFEVCRAAKHEDMARKDTRIPLGDL